jgi:hypothetical protein
VEKTLALYDRIERVSSDAGARADVPPLLEGIGLRMGLYFDEGTKRNKRTVRVLKGGVIMTGRAELPVPPYGSDYLPATPGATGGGAASGGFSG